MLDRATRPVAPTFSPWTVCHNDTVYPVLTSYFPDLPFSGNAQIRKFVPIRKLRVKYFKIRPSEHIKINLYSHNYIVSNAKKAFAELLSTVESTYDWLRTDERLPSYGRVRTVVVVRPYENSHLFSFFRDQRGAIPQVWNCVRPCEKTDERAQMSRETELKERKRTEIQSMCISRIAREGPSCPPIRIWMQRSPFSRASYDVLTKRHNRFPIDNGQ